MDTLVRRGQGKCCCVIGSSGCLGRELVAELLDRGYLVNAFDIQAPVTDDKRVKHFTGSITKKEELLPAVEGVDVVFNTASPNFFSKDHSLFHLINVEGTKNVIQCCVQASVPRLVATSSQVVQFTGSSTVDMTEDGLPYSTYDGHRYFTSKVEMEKTLLAADGTPLSNSSGQLMTAAIRLVQIFGPADLTFVNRLVERGDNNFVIGSGENVDIIYVTNAAHGHILAAEHLAAGSPVCGQAFNVTNEDPLSIAELQGKILAKLGYRPPRRLPVFVMRFLAFLMLCVQVVLRLFGISFNPVLTPLNVQLATISQTLNIDKAKRLLGYKPIVSMEEGILRTAQYFTAQRKAKKT